MAEVVGNQERREHGDRATATPEDCQGEETAEWQPAGPYEPVADAPERATECRTKTLNSLGWLAIELGARQRTNSDRREIRVRVEILALARERLLEMRAVDSLGQQTQRGLETEADAVTEQDLVVPGALNRQHAQEHRCLRAQRQCGAAL